MKIFCVNPPKFIKKILRLFKRNRRVKTVSEEKQSEENNEKKP